MDFSKLVSFDIECYPNYILFMFKKLLGGEVIYFEKFNDSLLNIKNILYIFEKYTLVTFNGIKFDALLSEAAAAGFSNADLYKVCSTLIEQDLQPWQVRKQFGFTALKIDQIDLIGPTPLKASLKIYGGRLHCKKMQDLPIEPGTIIRADELPPIRTYCENDLDLNILIFNDMKEELNLRILMSNEYGIDLRSKSDAQIAEQVIKSDLKTKYEITAKKPSIETGTRYRYRPPKNLIFHSDALKDIFEQYKTRPFTVMHTGKVGFDFKMEESDRIKSGKNKGKFPDNKKKQVFYMGATKYTVGIGGLHSKEKSTGYNEHIYKIKEYDVTSFYPRVILNNSLSPKHLGVEFLQVYGSIVTRRLKAKHEKNKPVNESLKIVINASFGKLGNKFSCLYSPNLMMQVTITGQLSLLMLIERLEISRITVISANTDGIVVKLDTKEDEILANSIVEDWEFDTRFDMEATDYDSLYSRDVNNYIALKSKGGTKGKGAYSNQRDFLNRLSNNPVNGICIKAVKDFLIDGNDITKTIRQCKDITEFITVRLVNGGALYENNLIGKAIRWYYSVNELDCMRYVTSGNKVPRSDGAKPIMELPDSLPDDIDYDWYITESYEILSKIGFTH